MRTGLPSASAGRGGRRWTPPTGPENDAAASDADDATPEKAAEEDADDATPEKAASDTTLRQNQQNPQAPRPRAPRFGTPVQGRWATQVDESDMTNQM